MEKSRPDRVCGQNDVFASGGHGLASCKASHRLKSEKDLGGGGRAFFMFVWCEVGVEMTRVLL